MASEALEETSEELLLDLSKTIFNAFTKASGSEAHFDDAFKNMFDRYTLSFIGGAVGGGIAGWQPSFRSARADKSMTHESAMREVVDFVQQGKEKELINSVLKSTWGNKYLDDQGNPTSDYTKS